MVSSPILAAEDAFDVVFICTGNRARSPLAAALYRRHAARIATTASSVGVMDVGAIPALPEAIVASKRLGVDLSSHTARPLRCYSLHKADLVVGFEPRHVAAAVIDGDAPLERTFLLGELVRLLGAPAFGLGPSVSARHRIAIVDSHRVRSRPDPTHATPDPLGKPTEVINEIADEIDTLVSGLVVGLFDSSPMNA